MMQALTLCCLYLTVQSSAADNVIWQIGASDNSYREFAIAGKFGQYPGSFPSDVTFHVGRDDPGKAWSFIHPGPSDSWAGGKAHTFKIVFDLDKPVDGTACLVVDLVDTHSQGPPQIEIRINDQQTRVVTPHGAGDASLGDPGAGRQHVIRVPVAGDVFHTGANTIELKNVHGSWMLYDAARLERLGDQEMKASMQVDVQSFVAESPAGPRQTVNVRIDTCGPAGTLTFTVAGQAYTQPVPASKIGGRQIGLAIAPVEAPAKGYLALEAGGKTFRRAIDVKPVRPWKIFLVQHTHSDVGYPDTQASLAARLVDYIDAALDYAAATKDYPDDARFRWTCEATWSVDLFLDTRGAERIAALKKAIADGQIELAGLPMNMTDLATEEVLIRALQSIARLRRVLGAQVTAAMQNDVNGYAIALPRLLAGCGVKYFATGINRTRSIVPFDRPTGLHWEAPDGTSVLTWRGEHYMAGNYFGDTTDPGAVADRLAGYLDSLVSRGYPHEAVLLQMSGYGTDDAWPSPRVCDLVKSWNERYASPKLRVATISEFFRAIEAKDAAKLPRIRKAWCDWWADGNGTAVQEVSLIRQTHEQLESAVALLAASGPKRRFPDLPAKIDHAFRRTLMFDEHTWGYARSINEPTSWMTKAQWGYKSAQAFEASMLTAPIYDAAREAFASGIPTKAPSLVIENPSSWPRGGVHVFRIPAPATYDRRHMGLIDVATGKQVPAERIGGAPIFDSIYAIDVPAVPALGYRVLRIDESAAALDVKGQLRCEGNVLENEFYRVEVDAKTGTLFSLRDKKANRELVNKGKNAGTYGLLQYVYEQVTDRRGRNMFWPPQSRLKFDRAVPDSVSIARGHDGPLVKSLHIRSRIGKGHTVDCELILYRRTPRLDVRLTLNKPSKTSPEAGYLAFPLALSKPVFDIDAVGGTFEPGPGQIDGTASDYHSIQRYIRMTESVKDGLDVVVASRATPLVQIGDIHVGQYQQKLKPPGPVFYMWLFNNYWFTNFPASQGGELQFEFSLTSRTRPAQPISAAHQFAVDYCTPMPVVYLPAGRGGSRPADQAGLIEIASANVCVTGMKWARDGNAVVIRLRELDGQPTKAAVKLAAPWSVTAAQRVNILEEPLGNLAVQNGRIEITLRPFEMLGVRLAPFGK